jgi:beta-N-acetylhexosaminidase
MKTLRETLAEEGVTPDEEIAAKIESMELSQKVGQMFMLAFGGENAERACAMISRHYLGGCYISDANADTPDKAASLSTELQRCAASSSGISLLIGVDQEGAWGVMMPHSSTGPGNLGLGAVDDLDLTFAMYKVIGKEMSAVGYNTLLAPCADVISNPSNPVIGMRSFGENADLVSRHVEMAICGARAGGVVTTVKHFPGHGNTAQDSHRGIPRVDRDIESLQKIDLAPFKTGIDAGVDIVMTSHILYSALDQSMPATLSKPIITGLLRNQLNFKGLVLSDSMNMRAMRKNYSPGEAAVRAVNAGVDMIMLAEEHYDHDTEKYEMAQAETIEGVMDAVGSGDIDESVIDRAVYRILILKKKYGMLGKSLKPLSPGVVGCIANRNVEEAICSRLARLLRNSAGRWPITRETNVALVRMVPSSAYSILISTRGIGPNQVLPSFDAFRDEFVPLHTMTSVFDYYDSQGQSRLLPEKLETFDTVLAVTEDYPLPGVDFDNEDQRKAMRNLLEALGEKLVVVGLRSPYELSNYPELTTYISICSSRPCAARAAARAAVGYSLS